MKVERTSHQISDSFGTDEHSAVEVVKSSAEKQSIDGLTKKFENDSATRSELQHKVLGQQVKNEVSQFSQLKAAELTSKLNSGESKRFSEMTEIVVPKDHNLLPVNGHETQEISHMSMQQQQIPPGPDPADAAPEPSFRTLRRKDKLPEVEEMQKQLNEWRVRNGRSPIKEDGNFGPETEAAVRDFQKAKGLTKMNGVVEDKTNQALRNEAMSYARNRETFENADRPKFENDIAPTLDPDTKPHIDSLMSAYSDNLVARQHLTTLVNNSFFLQLNPADQEKFLMEFEKNPTSPEHLTQILHRVETRFYERQDGYIPKLNSPGNQKKPISL